MSPATALEPEPGPHRPSAAAAGRAVISRQPQPESGARLVWTPRADRPPFPAPCTGAGPPGGAAARGRRVPAGPAGGREGAQPPAPSATPGVRAARGGRAGPGAAGAAACGGAPGDRPRGPQSLRCCRGAAGAGSAPPPIPGADKPPPRRPLCLDARPPGPALFGLGLGPRAWGAGERARPPCLPDHGVGAPPPPPSSRSPNLRAPRAPGRRAEAAAHGTKSPSTATCADRRLGQRAARGPRAGPGSRGQGQALSHLAASTPRHTHTPPPLPQTRGSPGAAGVSFLPGRSVSLLCAFAEGSASRKICKTHFQNKIEQTSKKKKEPTVRSGKPGSPKARSQGSSARGIKGCDGNSAAASERPAAPTPPALPPRARPPCGAPEVWRDPPPGLGTGEL